MINNDYLHGLHNQTNAILFAIESVLSKHHKCELGKVIAVYPDKKLVDIQPLTLLQDKQAQAITPPPVYGVSYFRLQAGNSAVIIDPAVGDIGFFACCDQDISQIVMAKTLSLPPTQRKDSRSDAIYFGSLLGAPPTQYIQFNPHEKGIEIITPNDVAVQCNNLQATVQNQATLQAQQITLSAQTSITLAAPQINVNGALSQGSGSFGGEATFSNNVHAPDTIVNGISVKSHTHGGVESGPSSTGQMQ